MKKFMIFLCPSNDGQNGFIRFQQSEKCFFRLNIEIQPKMATKEDKLENCGPCGVKIYVVKYEKN